MRTAGGSVLGLRSEAQQTQGPPHDTADTAPAIPCKLEGICMRTLQNLAGCALATFDGKRCTTSESYPAHQSTRFWRQTQVAKNRVILKFAPSIGGLIKAMGRGVNSHHWHECRHPWCRVLVKGACDPNLSGILA